MAELKPMVMRPESLAAHVMRASKAIAHRYDPLPDPVLLAATQLKLVWDVYGRAAVTYEHAEAWRRSGCAARKHLRQVPRRLRKLLLQEAGQRG